MIWPRLSVEQCASRPVVRLSGVLPPAGRRQIPVSFVSRPTRGSLFLGSRDREGRKRKRPTRTGGILASESHTALFGKPLTGHTSTSVEGNLSGINQRRGMRTSCTYLCLILLCVTWIGLLTA